MGMNHQLTFKTDRDTYADVSEIAKQLDVNIADLQRYGTKIYIKLLNAFIREIGKDKINRQLIEEKFGIKFKTARL